MIAELAGAVRLFDIPDKQLARLRKELTINYYKVGSDEIDIITPYVDCEGCIDVPRQFGLAYARQHGIQIEDFTSLGSALPKGGMQKLKPWEHQGPFIDSLYTALTTRVNDLIAEAATGKGKTVMSIECIRRLGRTAVIIVDQEFLRDQWIETAVKFFGVPRDKIGIIQGNTCDIEGKWIVVAMIQTLFSRQFPEYVYQAFGTMVVDECHTAGAPQFSKALMLFEAKYRWGVTATSDRGDALQKLLHWNLGKIEVKLEAEHMDSEVRYIEYPEALSWYANSSPKGGRFTSEIAADPVRNTVLANSIKWLYESGRNVLAVSDRIWHLENVMALCVAMGIPEDEMGIVAGYENIWAYAKNPTPPRRPAGWEKDTEYTPVCLQLKKKRLTKAILNERKSKARVVFATYGMFSKGVDEPRLSAGVDMTPRSKVVQVHGRILRVADGKLMPIWVTMRDFNSYKAEYQFLQRLGEYQKSNGEVYLWRPGQGKKLQDVAELKRRVRQRHQLLQTAEIQTDNDGRNIVLIPTTEPTHSDAPEKRTERTTRRRAAR